MTRLVAAASLAVALVATPAVAQGTAVQAPAVQATAVQATAVQATAVQATAAAGAATERGDEVYQYWCATCHGRGPGQPGTTALAAKYKGALAALLEERTDLTPQAIRFAVRQGTSIMPFFRKTEISDADLDAMTQYLARQPTAAR
jgi:mono/diheme cytochrome c family protein